MNNTTKGSQHTRLALAAIKADELLRELNQTVQAEQATLEEQLGSLVQAVQAGDGAAASQAHNDLYYAVKRIEVTCGTIARKLHQQRPTFETAESQKPQRPLTKKLVVLKGKGTDQEKRIETDVTMHWSEELQQYVTIPPREED